VWSLETGDPAYCLEQLFIRESNLDDGKCDFTIVYSILQRFFHSVRTGLDCIEEHAWYDFLFAVGIPHTSLFDGVHRTSVGRGEDLVPGATCGLEGAAAAESSRSAGEGVRKGVKLEKVCHSVLSLSSARGPQVPVEKCEIRMPDSATSALGL